MAGGRRQRHRGDEGEQDERQDGLESDERGEAAHRRTPDRGGRPGKRRKQAHAVDRGQDENGDEDRQLGQEQVAVCRPREARDALDLHERVHRSRRDQDDHRRERGAGEPADGAHCIEP